ncbi:unnamed protein product [Lota lota]
MEGEMNCCLGAAESSIMQMVFLMVVVINRETKLGLTKRDEEFSEPGAPQGSFPDGVREASVDAPRSPPLGGAQGRINGTHASQAGQGSRDRYRKQRKARQGCLAHFFPYCNNTTRAEDYD